MRRHLYLLLLLLLLAACSSDNLAQDVLSATSTPEKTSTPIASSTPTATLEPTPMGGGGRLLLIARSALYQKTHPELGDGEHLFVYDLLDHSLSPVAHPNDLFVITYDVSPDGRYLPYMLYESGLSENDALYLLDTVTLESSLLLDGFLYFDDLAWLDETKLFFTVWNNDYQVVQGFYYEIGISEPQAIIPEIGPFYFLAADSEEGFVYVRREDDHSIERLDLNGEVSPVVFPVDVSELNVSEPLTPDGKWLVGSNSGHGLALTSIGDGTVVSIDRALDEVRSNPSSIPQDFGWSPNQKYLAINVPGIGNVMDCSHWENFIWDIDGDRLVKLNDIIPYDLGCAPDIAWLPSHHQAIISTRWWDNRGNVHDAGADYIFSLESMSIISEKPNAWRSGWFSVSPDGNLAFSQNAKMEPIIVDVENFDTTPLRFPSGWFDDTSELTGRDLRMIAWLH